MPAHSRPKDGVASLAYVAGIHVFLECRKQDVDGRHSPAMTNVGCALPRVLQNVHAGAGAVDQVEPAVLVGANVV
jgi:hypothetical protein